MRLKQFSLLFTFAIALLSILIFPLALSAQASSSFRQMLPLASIFFGAIGLSSLAGAVGACVFAMEQKDDSLKSTACYVAAFCSFLFGLTFFGFFVGIVFGFIGFILCKVLTKA